MRLRNVSVLAAAAVLIGIWGASATGCINLDVGTTLPEQDSSRDETGLDEPGAPTNPVGNIVPAER